MHEFSVTQAIINIALEEAKLAHATRITGINLVVGEVSSIIDDCVQFYFNFLSRDTLASGAILSFTRIPMQVRCRNCELTFSPDRWPWSCPQCSQWNAEIVAGQEFYIDSIEVE